MRLLITLFLIFTASVGLAYGQTYYVSENSTGRGDGSSFSDRMSVATHNNSRFNGGDQILICGRIESQIIIPSSGTSGNPISYRGYKSNPAILTGRFQGQILGKSKSNIHIDQIEFDGSQNNGTVGLRFTNGCHYITITRCEIHDMISNYSKQKNAGIYFNSESGFPQNSHIIIGGSEGMGNEIYNIGVDTSDADIIVARTNDAIISYNRNYGNPNRISGIDGLTILSSKRILIEKNSFKEHNKYMGSSRYYHKSHHGEDGIDLKGVTDAIIRYNVIQNNRAIGINVNRDDPSSADCRNILIYNNLIFRNRANIRFAGSYDDETHSNIYVWGNVIHSATDSQNLISDTNGKNFYIYNNTFYNPLSSDRYQLSAGQQNFNIINNIFVRNNSRKQLLLYGATNNYRIESNLYYYNGLESQIKMNDSWRTATSIDRNGLDANPQLLDAKNNDFRIANNSPAIGSGFAISERPPSISIFGKTYNASYKEILSPTTDWSVFPPKVNTIIQNSNNIGWVLGAYGLGSSIEKHELLSPGNLREVK